MDGSGAKPESDALFPAQGGPGPVFELPPLSLYVHVPWCVRKCPYCDFNSHQKSGDLPEAEYVAALLEDLRRDSEHVQGRSLRSIFIGGGTPSLFAAASFEKLLAGAADLIPFAPAIEITLEANPGTFEQEKFRGFRAAGINRLSVGIQSFDDRFLAALGRIHDGGEARRAADIARAAGFDNFNLDLMFGLPGQTREQALRDIEIAVATAPAHLSWYQLTLEPNTEFHRFPPVLPDDDSLWDMQEAGMALLQERGFARYEISAYARPGRASVHNLNYWTFGDYLGIGAGAHGKLSLADGRRILRTRKARQPGHYLARAHSLDRRFTAECVEVPPRERPLEFMMNAMRLARGSDRRTFEARTGLDFGTVRGKLQALEKRGLARLDGDRFAPGPEGMRFLNDVLLAFLEEQA